MDELNQLNHANKTPMTSRDFPSSKAHSHDDESDAFWICRTAQQERHKELSRHHYLEMCMNELYQFNHANRTVMTSRDFPSSRRTVAAGADTQMLFAFVERSSKNALFSRTDRRGPSNDAYQHPLFQHTYVAWNLQQKEWNPDDSHKKMRRIASRRNRSNTTRRNAVSNFSRAVNGTKKSLLFFVAFQSAFCGGFVFASTFVLPP